MRCLAIDFGSSTIKGGVLDLDSCQVSNLVREPFPEALPSQFADQYEVCSKQIVQSSRRVIEQLTQLAPDARHLFAACQMGGCILVDKLNQPISNYLSWRDQRTLRRNTTGHSYVDQVRQRWCESQFEQLGRELKPGSVTSLLFWLKQQGMLDAKAKVVSIGDYVLSQLCGCEPKWDTTLAIGLLNLTTGQWHMEALAALGLDELVWPLISQPKEPIGKLPSELNSLHCYASIGDQQAALRGVNLQAGELSVNCSTGSQVSEVKLTFTPGDYQTRFWFDGQFLNTITHIPAGRSLVSLHDLLTELASSAGQPIENSWQLIAQAAERASLRNQSDKGSYKELRCDLCFFDSSLGFDGRIEGITTDNLNVGSLFEAAFDYMAQAYDTCAKRLSAEFSWRNLVVSGGLVQMFPTLRTRLLRRFSIPLRETSQQEETLLGLLEIAKEAAHRY